MNTDKQSQDRLAVLIDADNAQPSITEGLLAEVAKYGVASVKRIYGDWTTPALGGWKSVLLEHSIQPIQQFRYTVGKNATDSAMIIDAMDLLYTRVLTVFVLYPATATSLALRAELEKRDYSYTDSERKRLPSLSCLRATSSSSPKSFASREMPSRHPNRKPEKN